MSVLKKRTRQKEDSVEAGIYLGFKIPEEDAFFLSLFSLAEGITKTSIVRKLITDWVTESSQEYSEEYLIRRIANRTIDAWEKYPKRNTSYAGFKLMMKVEFKYRGMPPRITEEILNIVDDEKKERK